MSSEEGERSVELRPLEGIVQPLDVSAPGTSSVDERLGRLPRAAVIDNPDLRRDGSQPGREDVDVACVESGRRQPCLRLGRLESVGDRVTEREVVAPRRGRNRSYSPAERNRHEPGADGANNDRLSHSPSHRRVTRVYGLGKRTDLTGQLSNLSDDLKEL